MATLRKQMLQEAKERKSMEDAEREERVMREKKLVQTMKDAATKEIAELRSNAIREVEQMKKDAKEERDRMIAQQMVEQQLFRERAEEAKETLLKQTRWEMKVVNGKGPRASRSEESGRRRRSKGYNCKRA